MYTVITSNVLYLCRLNPSEQGYAVAVAFMGSPVVACEKLVSSPESLKAIDGMKKFLASGICESDSSDSSEVMKKPSKHTGVYEATGLENLKNDNVPLVQYVHIMFCNFASYFIFQNRRVTSLFCFETGGINSIAPLISGPDCGRTIITIIILLCINVCIIWLLVRGSLSADKP